ncbi:MAG: universal stress protein [Rhizobiales bacterium]|nr:universal stress protein [Hyphomicrobiales bacterium]
MKILAATDFSTRSNRALRQAALLAQSDDSLLFMVHVVDNDQPDDLVRMEQREAERILREQMGAMPEIRWTHARPMVIAGDPFDGILQAATEIQPDLIVMGSHRKQLLRDIFIGTTVERVIRKAALPVLMVNHEAQRRYERILAPTDMSDISANALHVARSIGLLGDGATLVHAFTALAKGKMSVAGVDRDSIADYIEGERRQASNELAAFLIANDLQGLQWRLRVEDGSPMEIISRAVTDIEPDLMVMGTHGRSRLIKALIGSTTEEALRSLNVDILVVPSLER